MSLRQILWQYGRCVIAIRQLLWQYVRRGGTKTDVVDIWLESVCMKGCLVLVRGVNRNTSRQVDRQLSPLIHVSRLAPITVTTASTQIVNIKNL